MNLDKVLGFPLEPARMDPDGTSLPPDVSALAPPSHPAQAAPELAPRPAPARFFEATRMAGLSQPPPQAPAAPPPPQAPAAALPRPPAAAPPAAPALRELAVARRSLRATERGGHTAPSILGPQQVAAAVPGRQSARRGLGTRFELLTGARRRWLVFAAGSAVAGFALALLSAFWLRVRADREAEPSDLVRLSETGVALAPNSPALASVECVPQRAAERILSGVSPTFPLEAATEPGSAQVLIGTALASGAAVGLELEATTFATNELLREDAKRELLGVVPVTSGPSRGFSIDRAGVGGLRESRSLPEQPAWLLARANRAFELVERANRRATSLWPLGPDEDIGRPKVAWQDSEHLAVVLRHGNPAQLALGWIEPRSGRYSGLRDLPFSGPELGVPSLALEGARAAIAAAVRSSGTEPWRVELVASEGSGEPRRIHLRALESATDLDRFAPSVSALGDARWFLQWTEGAPGARHVRGLTLDRKLSALGAPLELSRPGTSAGGGAVVAVDEGLVSLFLVQRGSTYELWAMTLSCR
jgi:hypothetical protein